MKEKLSIAMGHIFGDGGINNKGRVYYCNTEKFLIDEFVNSMNIFGIKPWVYQEKNIDRVIYPVSVGRELWNIFGKFSSGKDTKIITTQIMEMPLKWKAAMLQAWFNDDGSVINTPPNYKVVAIHQKLKSLVEFIKDVLNEFQIKSSILEDNNKWLLRICGYENIIKFRDNINFSLEYRKREKLNEMIKGINRPHFATKNKILQLLKESPKTRKEMAGLLNLSSDVVYGHLHGWKRKTRKSNKGLMDIGLVKLTKCGKVNKYFINSFIPRALGSGSSQ